MEKLVRLTKKEIHARFGSMQADEVWINDVYRVAVVRDVGKFEGRTIVQLTIKRHDDEAIHSWSDNQAIKNQLVGEECEGVELYPGKRVVDQLDRYHLWVISDPTFRLPFGWDEPAAPYDDTIAAEIEED